MTRLILVTTAAAVVLLSTGCETLRPSSQPAGLDPEARQFASMSSELGALRERLTQLELDVSQTRQENLQLRAEMANLQRGRPDAVTTSQLNQTATELRGEMTAQRREILTQVNRSVEDLANRTNTALEQMARQVNARQSARVSPATPQPLPADTPGQVYTVQAGDTLSTIARRFNTSVENIQRANQLTGTNIRVGQNLFIPERR
jgi:LysM repeat protein